MRKSVDKHIRISAEDNTEWKRKAKSACLSESALIRMLIKGYSPREKPDDRFYDAMNRVSVFSDNIRQLASICRLLGFVDVSLLYREIEAWQKFRSEIERRFLRPEESDMRWQ